MKYVILLTLTIAVCFTAIADPQTAPKVATDPPAWDQYQALVNQNIFVRNRNKPRPAGDQDKQAETIETPPAPHLILRGIVQRDQSFIAFIENTKTEKITTTHTGDQLDNCKIINLSLTSMQFTTKEQAYTISVGQMLSSQNQTSQQNYLFESTTPDTNANDDTATEKLSIIERLKRKREAQLKKDSKNE